MAQVAAEVARRSDPGQGLTGMARGQGFATPGRPIASLTGGSDAEANRFVDVGELLTTAAGTSDGDGSDTENPPPRFAILADAVRTGSVNMDAAALIKRALDQLVTTSPDKVVDVERHMAGRAARLSLAQVRRMIAWFLANADPAGLDERDQQCRQQRSVTIRDDADGMVTIIARLDAGTAAPVKTVLDAWVKDAFRRRRDRTAQHRLNPGSTVHDSASDVVDDRTAPQIRADALSALCAHALDCNTPTSGVKTTVIVRVNLADLQEGVGLGEIDGITSPVSVHTLRRIAADAQLIPTVMGADSIPLDLGRRHRLYNEYQRLALVERDGGCARCHAPPSYCETHHIQWWSHGDRTDIDNAVLLCTSRHHRIHDSGWNIHTHNDQVYFTPPNNPDPEARTPGCSPREPAPVGPDDTLCPRRYRHAISSPPAPHQRR